MYSGSTLTRYSGRIMGAHQKIDRIARRHMMQIVPNGQKFPGIRTILHFEGKNGPDGIKRKSPAKDEPWHFYDPFDDTDTRLETIIQSHYDQLMVQLSRGNTEKAGFEAAWLAHALVDGLTPAHHYPYEDKLAELRGGEANETRTSIKNKIVIKGNTAPETLLNNWKMWGAKGLMSTHGYFEIGVAAIMAPLNFSDAAPNEADMRLVRKIGIVNLFKRRSREIAELHMYREFYEHGWTSRLAFQVRHSLAPMAINTVTLAWYAACLEASHAEKSYASN